jgi:ADP-heptose:LPS heptosyltransferase
LQKGIDFSKLENFGVIDLSDNITDFADTAAIIENLDLIISVDTSVAHLAGAMGKNGWILLCYNSDWRWLLKRRDSPWYKTTKLFRQKTAGDWGGVFEEVYLELKKSSLLH